MRMSRMNNHFLWSSVLLGIVLIQEAVQCNYSSQPTEAENLTFYSSSTSEPTNFKEKWEKQAKSLDKLHIALLEKKILSLLRLKNPPPPRNDITARPPSFASRSEFSNDWSNHMQSEERVIRNYSLTVFGKQRNSQNINIEDGQSSGNCSSCSDVFSFNVRFQKVANPVKLVLVKGLLEISPEMIVKMYAIRAQNKQSAFSSDNDSNVVLNSKSRKIIDVTDILKTFWLSSIEKLTFNLTVKDAGTNPCLEESGNSNLKCVTPLLRLTLKEILAEDEEQAVMRSFEKRQTVEEKRTALNIWRNEGAPDCDTMWDRAFFKDVPRELYNDVVGGGCCRRRFIVDFRAIGWDHWIVSPEVLSSSYCLGRCQTYGGFHEDPSRLADQESTLYREIMRLQNEARNITPCCAPTKFDSITMTVASEDDHLLTQTLDDVIVSRCDCI